MTKNSIRSYLIFTGTGPILVLSTYAALTDERLVEKLRYKGIDKFIAYEVALEAVQERYEHAYQPTSPATWEAHDLRVLDFNGHQIMANFSLARARRPDSFRELSARLEASGICAKSSKRRPRSAKQAATVGSGRPTTLVKLPVIRFDEQRAELLDRVGARLVERLAGRDVVGDLALVEGAHADEGARDACRAARRVAVVRERASRAPRR